MHTGTKALSRIVGHHPGIIGMLLFGGLIVGGWCSLHLFFPGFMVDPMEGQQGIRKASLWGGLILSYAAWLVGSVFFGQNYGVNSWVAFFLGLIPVLGLGITRLIGNSMTLHEAWTLQNPGAGTEDRAARRNYRPMKPLY